VLKPGQESASTADESIRAYLASRLAAHKCPQRIDFVPELPKTATGKIQRYKLREISSFSGK